MKFYRFGNEKNPTIFLFPGTCCHWRANFGGVIPLLKDTFHVVCVSYDGFDETESTEFPDMLTETKKIERYIQKYFNGKICAAYGCSLGGSFVGLLIQREKIHIEHGMIGSSDLDQAGAFAAKLQARIAGPMIVKMLHGGKLPGFMEKRLEKKPEDEQEYYQKMLELFGIGSDRMSFVTKGSAYRQFYYDLITPLEENISISGTMIHCFYAEKMGEKYLRRYQQHFKNPDIRRHDMQHEELLICYPERWVQEVKDCCEAGAAYGK
ncbi:MAG: alpha/beta hydrolase [Eubacteriales bacterium]|nr:alpha/beta hydrolase [Eubacteriales bacterium]